MINSNLYAVVDYSGSNRVLRKLITYYDFIEELNKEKKKKYPVNQSNFRLKKLLLQ